MQLPPITGASFRAPFLSFCWRWYSYIHCVALSVSHPYSSLLCYYAIRLVARMYLLQRILMKK